MDIQKEALKLNKKIEKITQILTDGTPLTQEQKQAKEAERSNLQGQLLALNQQLPPLVFTKVIHKN